jgi:hypothetical protein
MPVQNTPSSRKRIVLSGLIEGSPKLDIAIDMVTIASVNEDGSCDLSEAALASAEWVRFKPINVQVEADQFHQLIETEEPIDVTLFKTPSCAPHKPSEDPHEPSHHHHGKPHPIGY